MDSARHGPGHFLCEREEGISRRGGNLEAGEPVAAVIRMKGVVYCLLIALSLSGCSAGTSRMEAKAMKNPIEPTSKSIAAGKIVYDKYCAECHGVNGDGVSEKAAKLAA